MVVNVSSLEVSSVQGCSYSGVVCVSVSLAGVGEIAKVEMGVSSEGESVRRGGACEIRERGRGP